MITRQTFLRFFAILLAILLAIVAGFVLAWFAGAPQAVWRADQSLMTSAIAALFALAVARIGVSAWRGGDWRTVEFGHLAVRLSVMFGFVGTALGLSMQAHAHALATEAANTGHRLRWDATGAAWFLEQ